MYLNRILLLTLATLSLTNQSYAMMRLSSPLRSPAQLRSLAEGALKKGMRNVCTAAEQQAPQRGRRYFVAGAVAATSAYYGVPYLLEHHLLASANNATAKQNKNIDNEKEDERVADREKRNLVTLHAQNPQTYDTFIREIIASGQNPHTFKTRTGETPLFKACEFGNFELFKLLVECNGNSVINDEFKYYKDKNGYNFYLGEPKHNTILSYICHYVSDHEQSKEMIQYLLSNPSLDINFERTDELVGVPQKRIMEKVHRRVIWKVSNAEESYVLYRIRQEEKNQHDACEKVQQKVKQLCAIPAQ